MKILVEWKLMKISKNLICLITVSLGLRKDCNNSYVTEESEYYRISDDPKENFNQI